MDYVSLFYNSDVSIYCEEKHKYLLNKKAKFVVEWMN